MKKTILFIFIISFFGCKFDIEYLFSKTRECTVPSGYENGNFGKTNDGVDLKSGDVFYTVMFKGDGIDFCSKPTQYTITSYYHDYKKAKEYEEKVNSPHR